MATQEEINAVVLEKLRYATRLSTALGDKPSSELIALLYFYYWGETDEVRDHAFALLADRYTMTQILDAAANRSAAIQGLAEAIMSLPVGDRRSQFLTDLLETIWPVSEDRADFINKIYKITGKENELLVERYKQGINHDSNFTIGLKELNHLENIKKTTLFEGVDRNKFSKIIMQAATELRKKDGEDVDDGLYAHFGRQRNAMTLYLLRNPNLDLRYFGIKIADEKDSLIKQELASVLSCEIDVSLAIACIEKLKDYPQLLSDSIAVCTVGAAVAYHVGRRWHRMPLMLNNMPMAIQASYQCGREESLLKALIHGDFRMRRDYDDINSVLELIRVISPSANAVFTGIPRVLLDTVGNVTRLTPPDDLYLEIAPAPQMQYLAKLIPQDSHARLSYLLTGRESIRNALEIEERRGRLRDDIAAMRVKIVQEARRRWRAQSGERSDSSRREDSNEDPSSELFPELTHGERAMLRNIEQTAQLISDWNRYKQSQQEISTETLESVVPLIPSGIPLSAEGILGTYQPVDRRLIVYSGMISLFASYLNCEPATLRTIALIHECAHAVLIHGFDRNNTIWAEFSATSLDLHEVLATIITMRTAEALATPDLIELSHTIAGRSEYRNAVALLSDIHPNDLFQFVASTRSGFLNGERKAMVGALGRLLSVKVPISKANGLADDTIIRKLISKSGIQQNAENLLKQTLLCWLCTRAGPNPDQALRLDMDAVEKAIERVGQTPPDQQIGSGLWPVLRAQTDFIAELNSKIPVIKAISIKTSTKTSPKNGNIHSK